MKYDSAGDHGDHDGCGDDGDHGYDGIVMIGKAITLPSLAL